ncbi:MAG: glycosyltransferase family 2 protein [Clostridia bacterium]|nr:glycosyltransferase family 2 protein [Clostridia bacterium]
MKLISFAIPSYNSEAYMRKCIDSILVGGEDVEIIIVNDGSKDGTAVIADEYAEKYPTICKAIHQENGGHGEGVNQGIRNATGLYYKVVDSDDWVDADALKTVLDTIKKHLAEGKTPDLYLTNFVYEHVEDNTFYVRKFTKKMPTDVFFGWKDVKPFHGSEVFLMHSLMYRTEVLRECKLQLPKHTFYVDNIFAYTPLPYVKTMFYIDVDLYRYFIGRADQSVNMAVFAKRTEQQNRVMKIMALAHDLREIKKTEPALAKYMAHALSCLMMITITFTVAEPSKEKYQALKTLWKEIKEHDKWLYGKLKHRSYATFYNVLPRPIGRAFMIKGYKSMAKKVKFG